MSVTSEPAPSEGTMSAERLEGFRSDVDQLKVSGGIAKWERVGAIVGLLAIAGGLLTTYIAYSNAQGAGDLATVQRNQVLAVFGLGIAIVGTLVWLRNSITRYLRWWNIRMVYEQRQQTDRVIDALREKR